MSIGLYRSRKERRRNHKLIFIERRKGKFWLYGQMILFPVLIVILLWLLIS